MKDGCWCEAMSSGDPKQMEAHCVREFIPQGRSIKSICEG